MINNFHSYKDVLEWFLIIFMNVTLVTFISNSGFFFIVFNLLIIKIILLSMIIEFLRLYRGGMLLTRTLLSNSKKAKDKLPRPNKPRRITQLNNGYWIPIITDYHELNLHRLTR